jgi:hypothetical protein
MKDSKMLTHHFEKRKKNRNRKKKKEITDIKAMGKVSKI